MRQQKIRSWSMLFLLAIVAVVVQSCLGFGGGGQQFATSSSGQAVTVNQNTFQGKFYLTVNGNLYVLNGTAQTTQELVNTGNVIDPAVSPDGKWVAFVEKYQNYSNLCVVSTSGGQVRILRNGNGSFVNEGGPIHNTYVWYVQPAWSPDGSTLLFLSDLEKEDWYQQTGQNAPLLDLQVFSIPFSNPSATPTDVAYATFGDGGDQNPSYRPGHPNQIIYTHYTYDAATQTQQVIQLYMEDPNAISGNPGVYYPGSPGGGYDPSIAITPTNTTITDPAFSPDGTAIAFIKTDSSGNRMALDVMPVPPANITQTPNDPNTEQLALQAFETKSSSLLASAYLSEPVWSPDGKQLAYYTFANNTFDLWIANLSLNTKTGTYSLQGNPIQVTSGGVDAASHPVWTK
jgi:dipeptidyl aminopeptidase/acylaminoacyl peptidase